ncbi:MAG TPA: tetratricopeptide repeat protein [Ignavibacteriaceae bacterium]|nr:tetratricopeptide repeat protein [Ignavibacteriaceae bacterium]
MKGLLVFIICLFNFNSFAEDSSSLYKKGLDNYKSANYDSSIVNFEKVVNAGFESPELYYNLGNSFFRKGRLADAVLYYERALKLSPNDKDIKDNLNFVNSKLVDKPLIYPKFFLFEWIDNILSFTSLSGWFFISLILFLIFLIIAALFFFVKQIKARVSFSAGVIMLLLFFISVAFTGTKYKRIFFDKQGIVKTFTVKSTLNPNENSKELFQLHEGSKVEIKDSTNGFYKIKNNTEKEGWIKKEDVIII